ncbi:oxysterol-binding protein-related protein 11 isoform X1 [Lampetra planeri]
MWQGVGPAGRASPERGTRLPQAAPSSSSSCTEPLEGGLSKYTNVVKGWQSSDANQLESVQGALMKYTNLVQGWQYRYFVLNTETGMLEYFVSEPSSGQKPRGALQLAGAVISPSDEDSHTFTVNAANGEQYRLRGLDAKERQHWVSRLQACVQHHTEAMAKNNPPLKGRSFLLKPGGLTPSPGTRRRMLPTVPTPAPGPAVPPPPRPPAPAPLPLPALRLARLPGSDQLMDVREMLGGAENQQRQLVSTLESLSAPDKGQRQQEENVTALDRDLLMLKATTAAALRCLSDCLSVLNHQQSLHQPAPPLPAGMQVHWFDPKPAPKEGLKNGVFCPGDEDPTVSRAQAAALGAPDEAKRDVPDEVNFEDEVTDDEEEEEEQLGPVEEQRGVILHLLSQLKLGMDLTRVVLPTFILEKRSLLEMYADLLALPQLLLAVADAATPEERMLAFLRYYLAAVHQGRRGALARKPYNPALGETFRCSWSVPPDGGDTAGASESQQQQQAAGPAPAPPAEQPCPGKAPVAAASSSPSRGSDPGVTGQERPPGSACPPRPARPPPREPPPLRLRFTAEQVSHHPPISAFHAECPEKNLCLNAHVWTKSKFMGMSIGVGLIGDGVLQLLDCGEEYTFTLPSAYARSILTVPWLELGGKVHLGCMQTGYSASVTFHTKPFYGGKLHRVTAEVKHVPSGTVVCKAQGEWNGVVEFVHSSGETRSVDIARIPVCRKRVRPVSKQWAFESRRLWQCVTEALRAGDLELATQHKHELEERQRQEERRRAESGTPWNTQYFSKEGEGWVFNHPQVKASLSGFPLPSQP